MFGSDRGPRVFKDKKKQQFLQIPGKIPVTSARLKNIKKTKLPCLN